MKITYSLQTRITEYTKMMEVKANKLESNTFLLTPNKSNRLLQMQHDSKRLKKKTNCRLIKLHHNDKKIENLKQTPRDSPPFSAQLATETKNPDRQNSLEFKLVNIDLANMKSKLKSNNDPS